MPNDCPVKTRQVVFPSSGEVEFIERDLPPLAANQMRVKTGCSLISAGTECASLVGPPWKRPDGTTIPSYPVYPGYSNAGTVVAVGNAVKNWHPGDKIASSAGHAEYVTLSQTQPSWHIPEEASLEDAIFTTLSATVLNGVRLGAPQLGEIAVVIGLGLIGQMACEFLSVCGLEVLIGADVDPFRLDLAESNGKISHTLNPADQDPTEAVHALSEGRGADLVIEATGRTETFDLAFDLSKTKGRVVALGSPRWPAPVDMMQVHMKGLHLIGAIVSSHPVKGDAANRWDRDANADLYLRMARAGKCQLRRIITHRFPGSSAAEAYKLLTEKTEPCVAVALDWE